VTTELNKGFQLLTIPNHPKLAEDNMTLLVGLFL